MAAYIPVPTYAPLEIKEPSTGREILNPVWRTWFEQVAVIVSAAGGGTIPPVFMHNGLSGLQGGGTTERYHLTAAEHAAVSTITTADDASFVLAQRTYREPPVRVLQDSGVLMQQIFGA